VDTHLFTPLTLRGITARNRIGVSPMCMYSAEDGHANNWHLVHLGSRAVGGAGVVMMEATAIEARGRISPADTGIWDAAHVDSLKPITAFISAHGGIPAIQLAHAGRKASTAPPWEGSKPVNASAGGWSPVVGASPIPFREGYQTPQELSVNEIRKIVIRFVAAARRAVEAGFKMIEIHAAHGYLLHSFYSPLTNKRADEYGGSLENRARLTVEVAQAVRVALPDDLPLVVRLSCSDWIDDGWTIDDSVILARMLKDVGVDMIDCSSGGAVAGVRYAVGPGYQTQFAHRIRTEAGIPTAAVGMITDPAQADHIIRTGQADMILMARQFLRDPYWPLHAAQALGQTVDLPNQYARGF
jgi:2,4-dienoyl-CoA reductase-like NADH-dependent reductase (Old Yellow Enzyme family)